MSRDIRSYFSSTNKQLEDAEPKKPVRRRAISSSDEEQSNGSKLNSQKKFEKVPRKKDKKTHILSDSDDDTTHKKTDKVRNSPMKKVEKALKPVSIESIFGKTPIKRVNATPIPKKLQKEEALIHEDDDFEATLNQIDISEIDAMYSGVMKDNATNSKRKKSFSQEVAPSKKLKSNDFTQVENKDKKLAQKSHQSTENQSNKSKSSNERKSPQTHERKPKLDIVVEKNKTKKVQKSDEKVDLIEEHIAKKKQQVIKYQAYLHRGGARNPGSKPIPEGAENCLAGLSFVVTGILDSLERDEVDSLIEKYGGRVLKALSRKTDYLVVGDEAGESKLEKARDFKTKQISEDELLEMIRSLPVGKASKIIQGRSKKKEPPLQNKISSESPPKLSVHEQTSQKNTKLHSIQSTKLLADTKEQRSVVKKSTTNGKQTATLPKLSSELNSSIVQKKNNDTTKKEGGQVSYVDHSQALVEKYRPKSFKQIIGQHGDKSAARKFYTWLQNWHKNQNSKTKQTKPSPWAKNDDGSFFKACLLSGPPGVGKTTTVQVVCNELGYDLLEFNASDTRSKRLLKEEISGLLSNTTVKGYFSNNFETRTSTKHVLLMDEVDGMAGNEDRGGLQELVSLIKSTEIPIVCICNDRNNPKMRTLSNYTFDLRFPKPRVEQIRGAMKSLCCKENITITTENLDRLIQSTNQDIRQVINHLAMLANTVNSTSDNKNKEGKDNCVNKDLKLGPWDVVRKVFSAEEHKTMTIHDKSDLFFHDYNIAGLFVQENYLTVAPKCPKGELLERVAASAESLAMGDLVENSIRENGSWSMLPIQACFSSVIPGTFMSGHMTGQINFPAWLGRNSKRGKFDRLLQEITVHTRLVTSASKEAINLDYLKSLRDAILRPLVTDGIKGVETALATMNHYHLLRDDLDALVEVSLWPGQRDPMQSIESKVKAAFTRAYNKSAVPTPFAVGATLNKKSDLQTQDSGFIDSIEDDGAESDNENDDTLDGDRMVKAKKSIVSKTTASDSNDKASTSRSSGDRITARRGRGRGRGK